MTKVMTIKDVDDFISANVYHSKLWDRLDDQAKGKLVSQAHRTLLMNLEKYYPEGVPLDHLAEQCLWMLRLDDSILRSELGVTYIQIDGVAMNISEKDRTIAPYIYQSLKIPPVSFRRTGHYSGRLNLSRY